MGTVRRYILPYTGAIAAALAATIIRIGLEPLVGAAVPFATYEGAVILVAWYCGFCPAAVCVASSAWLGAHFILRPESRGLLTAGESARASILAFTLVSLAIGFLIDFQRRTLARARAAEKAQSIAAAGLQQSNEELKRANRDLELFAYSASHDLQEPLRSISISAQLMERDFAQRPPDRELVRQIIAASQRMDGLIQDVLAYVKAATTDLPPPAATDSRHVFDDVVASLQGSIMASGAVVTAGQLPVIVMHENRLAQIFQNLISNAIKYRGTEPPRVHVDAWQKDGAWIFAVSDNGIGIEEQFSRKIFGLFKRLHTQEKYQGSGMGLAICQRIVEQYGGRIWLERSEPDKGSTFCFSIPMQLLPESKNVQD